MFPFLKQIRNLSVTRYSVHLSMYNKEEVLPVLQVSKKLRRWFWWEGKNKNVLKAGSRGSKWALASSLHLSMFKCAGVLMWGREGRNTLKEQTRNFLPCFVCGPFSALSLCDNEIGLSLPGPRICIFLLERYTSFLTEVLLFYLVIWAEERKV